MSMKQLLRGSAFVVLALALLSTGCIGTIRQAAQKTQDSNDLKQIVLTYHMFHDEKSRGPDTVDEFSAWAQQKAPEAAIVIGSIKSGKYVFYMGVRLTTLTDGTVNTVLGYAATTPTAGGLVVMADGSVQTMTAAQFAAAPKPPNGKLSQP